MTNTTIHKFARTNEVDSLTKAIRAGANVNEKDKFGTTALHYSICEGNHDVTRLLLENGADVSISDDGGATALHYAVEYDLYDVAEALLKRDVKVLQIADKHGNQPLWTSVFNASGVGSIAKQELYHLVISFSPFVQRSDHMDIDLSAYCVANDFSRISVRASLPMRLAKSSGDAPTLFLCAGLPRRLV